MGVKDLPVLLPRLGGGRRGCVLPEFCFPCVCAPTAAATLSGASWLVFSWLPSVLIDEVDVEGLRGDEVFGRYEGLRSETRDEVGLSADVEVVRLELVFGSDGGYGSNALSLRNSLEFWSALRDASDRPACAMSLVVSAILPRSATRGAFSGEPIAWN
jgi:hypothetical protein